MRKKGAALITAILVLATANAYLNNSAQANPYRYIDKWVPPPADAVQLIISVSSPKNRVVYDVNDVMVAFEVTTQGTSMDGIGDIHFVASWLQSNVTIPSYGLHTYASYNETFYDLPDGDYSILIIAQGGGSYIDPTRIDYFDGTIYHFTMTTTSIINFTVAAAPKVSILDPRNETYISSEVLLNLAGDKPFSKISYVLDQHENITINGNATLTGLTDGIHNLTVFAWDTAGNICSSETIAFTVDAPEPFPAILVSTISLVTAIAVGASWLFDHKKRRRQVGQS